MADRCTGHCCQRFTLPLSPDEIRENYDAWRAQKSEDSNKRVPLEDIWLLVPMVRYLGFLHSDSNGDPSPEGRHWYRCVHLQDGNCSIYEHRPRMCREYPYGKACKYHGCTWDAAREGRVNEKGEETPVRQPDSQPATRPASGNQLADAGPGGCIMTQTRET